MLVQRTWDNSAVRSTSRPLTLAATACLARSRSNFFKASATVVDSGIDTGTPSLSCTLISLILRYYESPGTRSARSEIFIALEPANESQAPLGAQSPSFISLLKELKGPPVETRSY